MEHVAGPRQLRRLLDGVMTIGSDLDLHTVLHTIISAAAELVSARYGALGVLDPSGTRLSEFVTVGIDDASHAAIGHLPEGLGILGLLIVDPKPLRLPDLSEHPARFGFPKNHPPMKSFLGVPIAVRGVSSDISISATRRTATASPISTRSWPSAWLRRPASPSRTPASSPGRKSAMPS